MDLSLLFIESNNSLPIIFLNFNLFEFKYPFPNELFFEFMEEPWEIILIKGIESFNLVGFNIFLSFTFFEDFVLI